MEKLKQMEKNSKVLGIMTMALENFSYEAYEELFKKSADEIGLDKLYSKLKLEPIKEEEFAQIKKDLMAVYTNETLKLLIKAFSEAIDMTEEPEWTPTVFSWGADKN